MRNNRGPKTVPWGTPEVTGASLDHKVEERLSNTLTLPSQYSLPIDRKLEPEWLPRA